MSELIFNMCGVVLYRTYRHFVNNLHKKLKFHVLWSRSPPEVTSQALAKYPGFGSESMGESSVLGSCVQ